MAEKGRPQDAAREGEMVRLPAENVQDHAIFVVDSHRHVFEVEVLYDGQGPQVSHLVNPADAAALQAALALLNSPGRKGVRR